MIVIDNALTVGMTILLVSIGLYFLPALVAAIRSHRQAVAILVLNLFFGWTVFGWAGALVWACTGDVEPCVTLEFCRSCAEPVRGAGDRKL